MKCRNCKNLTHLYEDGEPYEWCEKVIDSPYIDRERDCRHYEAATNGDKLRRMTDEELAKWISGAESLALTCGSGMSPDKWLEYLKRIDET